MGCLIIFLLIFNLSSCKSFIDNEEDQIESKQQENEEMNEAETGTLQNKASTNPFYSIEASFDEENKQFQVKQTILYTNLEDCALEEIYLNVYPNSFKDEETAPFTVDMIDEVYEDGFNPGFIEIEEIIDKKEAKQSELAYSFSGIGNINMKVELNRVLEIGATIEIGLTYTIQVPKVSERFGYSHDYINMGNWYPILAVYNQEGWNLDPYYSIGDPFFSDCADYDVTIELPKDYMCAATGNLVEMDEGTELTKWHFQETQIRDFAFAASKFWDFTTIKVGDTTIKAYVYKENTKAGKIALETGAKSVEIFNKLYGTYPYNTLSVVETEIIDGMEYPGIVFIDSFLYSAGQYEQDLIDTVSHEVAHQWWYAIVGNDQIDEAWLDESFATYSEMLYSENEETDLNPEDYLAYWQEEIDYEYELGLYNGDVVRSLDEFDNWDDYEATVYFRGALLLQELRDMVGDELFFEIMQTYYKEYQFQIAGTDDFIRVCEEVSGEDSGDLFEEGLGYYLFMKSKTD